MASTRGAIEQQRRQARATADSSRNCSFATWWTVMALAARNRAARYARIAPSILSPLGTTFGLLVGFLAVQVWNDSQHAHEAVIQEAGALRTAVLLASNLSPQVGARIDLLIARHIEDSANREWPAMADQRATCSLLPFDRL